MGQYIGGTGVAYASLDIACGDKIYTVTTGNNKGECASSGNGNHAMCEDGEGNSTKMTCANGCGGSTGKGRCEIKK